MRVPSTICFDPLGSGSRDEAPTARYATRRGHDPGHDACRKHDKCHHMIRRNKVIVHCILFVGIDPTVIVEAMGQAECRVHETVPRRWVWFVLANLVKE